MASDMVQELQCMISVSGVRGIVGAGVDPATVLALAAAFGRSIACGGSVVLGRDSRPSGPMLAQAVASGLQGVGCEVIDLGIVPTPTVPIMQQELGAQAGIQISASHNPVAWNALKFFGSGGRNIDSAQLQSLLAAYRGEAAWQPWQSLGSYRVCDGGLAVHVERVLAAVDVAGIRAAGLRVLVDSVNGAGSRFVGRLLPALGCRLIPLYNDPSQLFPRDPEPTAANVTETGAVVRAVGADVGFVQDPDADRLAVIDEQGRYIGEEYTLVLCAAARLAAMAESGVAPLVCTNLSTSRMLEDVAASYGGRVTRSPIGEANVVDAMQAGGAVIGGEGNGGVIDPRVVWGRDSHIGMALILELMARRGCRLSELVAEIPAYHIHKEKISIDRAAVQAAAPRLQKAAWARGAAVDERDGIKLSWPEAWVHLRASGTEPVSRIISEAASRERASELAALVRQTVLAETPPV